MEARLRPFEFLENWVQAISTNVARAQRFALGAQNKDPSLRVPICAYPFSIQAPLQFAGRSGE